MRRFRPLMRMTPWPARTPPASGREPADCDGADGRDGKGQSNSGSRDETASPGFHHVATGRPLFELVFVGIVEDIDPAPPLFRRSARPDGVDAHGLPDASFIPDQGIDEGAQLADRKA